MSGLTDGLGASGRSARVTGLLDAAHALVPLVPAGRVVSYGDIAALLEANPRTVGRAMALVDDPDIPWWRVTSASGRLPEHLVDRACERWSTEGTPMRTDGRSVDMARARTDLAGFAADAERLLGELPGLA